MGRRLLILLNLLTFYVIIVHTINEMHITHLLYV